MRCAVLVFFRIFLDRPRWRAAEIECAALWLKPYAINVSINSANIKIIYSNKQRLSKVVLLDAWPMV